MPLGRSDFSRDGGMLGPFVSADPLHVDPGAQTINSLADLRLDLAQRRLDLGLKSGVPWR